MENHYKRSAFKTVNSFFYLSLLSEFHSFGSVSFGKSRGTIGWRYYNPIHVCGCWEARLEEVVSAHVLWAQKHRSLRIIQVIFKARIRNVPLRNFHRSEWAKCLDPVPRAHNTSMIDGPMCFFCHCRGMNVLHIQHCFVAVIRLANANVTGSNGCVRGTKQSYRYLLLCFLYCT